MPGVRVRREWLPGTEIRRGVLALAVRVDFDDISTPQPDIHTGEQEASTQPSSALADICTCAKPLGPVTHRKYGNRTPLLPFPGLTTVVSVLFHYIVHARPAIQD